MTRAIRTLPVLATLALAACTAGKVGEAVRPDENTAAGALGEPGECTGTLTKGEPLIVDWKPEQRGDLEIAMREGVAVVEYTCNGIRVLDGCHLEGSYGYIGMTRREQVVRLNNGDEVRANLPLSGVKLAAELERGSSLDIAMVMVGRKRTTWTTPTKEDLVGACDGATHFVRGATVGAFVFETNTSGKVMAAAEFFKAGVGAASASERDVQSRDGDLASCEQAAPDSEAAPAQCGAPMRLFLVAVADADVGESASPSATVACPGNLVVSDGKCTSPDAAKGFQCRDSEPKECSAQCDAGHAGSCRTLGALHVAGRGVTRDPQAAAKAFASACTGGDAAGCTGQGRLTADRGGAAKLFEKGCAGGDAAGCGLLGRALIAGAGVAADPARAVRLLRQGCDGGDAASCGALAGQYAAGKGVKKDRKLAAELHTRACAGNIAASCQGVGELYEAGGPGVTKNVLRAKLAYQRACTHGHAPACVDAGRVHITGPGGGANTAKHWFSRGCTARAPVACAVLKVEYGETRAVTPDVKQKQAWNKGCNGGDARSCLYFGLLSAATGNKVGAAQALKRACTKNDKWACSLSEKVE